jgi:hypothetical protein
MKKDLINDKLPKDSIKLNANPYELRISSGLTSLVHELTEKYIKRAQSVNDYEL